MTFVLIALVLAQEPTAPPLVSTPPVPPPEAAAPPARTDRPAAGVPMPSTPPLVGLPMEPEPEARSAAEPKTGPRLERPPSTSALHFLPLSLFGLYLGVEYERGATESVSFFGAAGGGPFGQLGFDAGARVYVVSSVLDGLFLDARASAFVVLGAPMVLLGPGLTLGYSWRLSSRAVLSLGLGAQVWVSVVRQQSASAVFFGGRPDDVTVLFFPGLQQPPRGQPAMQPTLRFTVGPGL